MRIRNLSGKLWSIITSPKVIVALNCIGGALQLIHQIEQYRQSRSQYQDNKIGFKFEGEEDER